MAKVYDQARQVVLEDHPWHFARKRRNIAAESADPEFEYAYKYELPTDYLRLVRIGEDWFYPNADYEIESNYLLIDEAGPLKIVYIFDVTDVSKFSAKFIEALAIKMAAMAAHEITGNAGLMDMMDSKYKDSLASAASVAGQNRPPRRIQHSKLAAARQNWGRKYNYIAE
jgi:hypothetical protein